MKRYLRMYSYLIRPIIYKIIARAFLGIVFSLLWNHFINPNRIYIMAERPFFLVGVVMLTMAWLNYLKLDGVGIDIGRNINKKKDKFQNQSKGIINFLEEEVKIHELEEDDETISAMIANIITGICFLIPSIIFMYF